MATQTVDLSKMNTQELLAHIAKLEAEKKAAETKAQEQASYSVKIGRSGTVSVSGFGRYPISLYKNQMQAFCKLAPSIAKFIQEHEAEIDERAANPVPENSPNPSKSFKLSLAA